jgi:hypothetical protein
MAQANAVTPGMCGDFLSDRIVSNEARRGVDPFDLAAQLESILSVRSANSEN